ncbi:unnamed protein product [Caretta caretta]
MRETLAHVYLECARLQPLFPLLLDIMLYFWLHFSPHLFIYALPIHGLTKSQDLLVNILLALAKMTINKTRERRLANGGFLRLWGLFSLLSPFTYLGRVALGGIRWLP